MPKFGYVYGLFDAKNVCVYVGKTVALKSRSYAQRKRFQGCRFRIIERCALAVLDRREFHHIRKRELNGECKQNIAGRLFRDPKSSLSKSERKAWCAAYWKNHPQFDPRQNFGKRSLR